MRGTERYRGFISHSHAADGQLAPALQRGLHRLAKPWYRSPPWQTFRDQTAGGQDPEGNGVEAEALLSCIIQPR
jgi:hypothetical protein